MTDILGPAYVACACSVDYGCSFDGVLVAIVLQLSCAASLVLCCTCSPSFLSAFRMLQYQRDMPCPDRVGHAPPAQADHLRIGLEASSSTKPHSCTNAQTKLTIDFHNSLRVHCNLPRVERPPDGSLALLCVVTWSYSHLLTPRSDPYTSTSPLERPHNRPKLLDIGLWQKPWVR